MQLRRIRNVIGDMAIGKKNWLREELPSLLLLLAFIMVARSSFADHYFVPSGSMEFTLMPGDRVFVDKSAYGLRIPFTNIDLIDRNSVGRGEIVIFDSPRDGTRLIKRVIAVGGDSIVLSNGLLQIDGEPLLIEGQNPVEKFGERLAALNLQHGGGPDIARTKIPEGMVLAVGDHRGSSLDGRFFGLVAEGEVYGKAIAVYYRRGDGFTWKNL